MIPPIVQPPVRPKEQEGVPVRCKEVVVEVVNRVKALVCCKVALEGARVTGV